MAVGSLLFLVPLSLLMSAAGPGGASGPSLRAPLAMPRAYLMAGHLTTVVGCPADNFLFKHLGGFEFDLKRDDAP